MYKINFKSSSALTIISILLASLMVFSFGCVKKEEKEIKIGAILPLTGDGAVYGIKEKEGIELAVEENNATGGIRGKKIKVIFEDSKGEPARAVSAVQKLISQDKVNVVIGDAFSSPTLAIVPIIDKNKVILMSPTASNPKLSNSSEYFFRVWPSDVAEGAVAANLAVKKLNLKKLAILYGNNDYAIGLKEVFSKTIKELGMEILLTEVYNEGDSDFRAQLTRIKKLSPDGIYLAGYAKEFAKILVQAKELNIKSQFVSCGTFHEPEILKISGMAAEGVVFVQPYFDRASNDINIQKFVKSYENKFGSEAGVYAAHGYDAANVVIHAMKKGGTTSSEIKNILNNIKDFPGATGSITFIKGGDVIKPMRIMMVKGGHFVTFEDNKK